MTRIPRVVFLNTVCALIAACGDGVPLPTPDDIDAGAIDAGPIDAGTVVVDAGCRFAEPVGPVSFTPRVDGATTSYWAGAANSRGLVVALHGTNGSAASVALGKVEWQAFFSAALGRGYSVLVPESLQRTSPRRWDNAPTSMNPDLVRLVGLLEQARRDGVVSPQTPVMLIGMSQGGGVAPLYAQLLAQAGYPVRAVAVHSAAPLAVVSHGAYRLPTSFLAMAGDALVDPADTRAAAEALARRGIEAPLFIKPVEALCAGRLTRITGLDAKAADDIFAGLVAAGTVTDAGAVVGAGTDVDASSSLLGVPPAYAGWTKAVDEQLQVVSARHAFTGERAAATLDFFDRHR